MCMCSVLCVCVYDQIVRGLFVCICTTNNMACFVSLMSSLCVVSCVGGGVGGGVEGEVRGPFHRQLYVTLYIYICICLNTPHYIYSYTPKYSYTYRILERYEYIHECVYMYVCIYIDTVYTATNVSSSLYTYILLCYHACES
jgi:hypothetical protein